MLYSSTATMKIQKHETVTAWKSKKNMVWQNESFKARQKGSYLLNKLHKHLKPAEAQQTATHGGSLFSFVF